MKGGWKLGIGGTEGGGLPAINTGPDTWPDPRVNAADARPDSRLRSWRRKASWGWRQRPHAISSAHLVQSDVAPITLGLRRHHVFPSCPLVVLKVRAGLHALRPRHTVHIEHQDIIFSKVWSKGSHLASKKNLTAEDC